jgi:hypothetical protein
MMERAERLKRRATNEDLLEVPDHLVAEIVDGELFTTPRPALRHAHASSTLGGELVHAVPFEVLALDLLVLWGEERPSSAL